MTMAKKGSRAIVVRGTRYRWKVGAPRRTSPFADAPGVVDEAWTAIAQRYGLGRVASIALIVAVEAEDSPNARLLVRYAGKVVDGFLGPEQLASITPRFVRAAIERALDEGWPAPGAMHLAFDVVATEPAGYQPILLPLPEAALPKGHST